MFYKLYYSMIEMYLNVEGSINKLTFQSDCLFLFPFSLLTGLIGFNIIRLFLFLRALRSFLMK